RSPSSPVATFQAASSSGLLLAENNGAAPVQGTEAAARAVASRDPAIANLAVRRVPPQLSCGLHQQKDPAGPGVIRRQPATIGIKRPVAVELQVLACDEWTALTRLAEAKPFNGREHSDGVRVVQHCQIDVVGGDARFAEGARSRARRRVARVIAIAGGSM